MMDRMTFLSKCSHSIPFTFSTNVLELSSSSALAEEKTCDILYFPLEDSRAANNSMAKPGESKAETYMLSFFHPT